MQPYELTRTKFALLGQKHTFWHNFKALRSITCQIVNYTVQGPSLLKNFGGTNLYCLRFDVTMFTQP